MALIITKKANLCSMLSLAVLVLNFIIRHNTVVELVIVGLIATLYTQCNTFVLSSHDIVNTVLRGRRASWAYFITLSSFFFHINLLSKINSGYFTSSSIQVNCFAEESLFLRFPYIFLPGIVTVLFGLMDKCVLLHNCWAILDTILRKFLHHIQ